MAVIDGIILKGRHIANLLQQIVVNWGIQKIKLLTYESIYWIGMNLDIEKHIKIAQQVLIFSKCSQRKK